MNIRLSAPFRLILAALLVLSLQACATRGTEIGTSAPSDASNAAWQAYQGYASARASDHDPYRLSGSLRYGSQGDTRPVETLLWSNGYLPIRLDVMAGIGALVARIQETQDSFTAYAPNENKAIVHKGPQRVQLNFGRPVPFSLRDFSSLMRGRFHEVFGAAEGLNPRALPNGDIAFTLSGGILPGMLELRPDGLPVRWSAEKGWVMDITYDDGNPPLPYKFKLTHPDGYSAILLVKDRQKPNAAFRDDQLALELPAGTIIEPIKKGGN